MIQFTLHPQSVTNDQGIYLPGRISDRRLASAAVGGFIEAGFRHYAHESQLWAWVGRLLYRGCFYNWYANKAWEGIVHTVTLHLKSLTKTYSLEKLINRAQFSYTDFTGLESGGAQLWTNWADDLTSQARYDVREAILSGDQLTDAAADNMRDAYLALFARPFSSQPVTVGGGVRPDMYADIMLRGYWTTTRWQTYFLGTDTDVENSAQIEAILTSDCPLISTDYSNIEGTSVTTNEYRDERATCQDEILRLMGQGNSTPERLIGGVWEDRKFHLSAPSTSIKYYVNQEAQEIRDQHYQKVHPWDVRPDGMVLVEDLEPTGYNFPSNLDDPRMFYLERVSYRDPGVVELVPLGQEELGSIIVSMGLRWHGA